MKLLTSNSNQRVRDISSVNWLLRDMNNAGKKADSE